MSARNGMPVLWHIEISHYNEKARWALGYKGVAHRRRAPLPGSHMLVAYALTREITFPILQIDGRAIGDSTAIIAELERRYPDPPLYPADPAERERALALEDWFDEELGPHFRRAVFDDLLEDPESVQEMLPRATPPAVRRFSAATWPAVKRLIDARYGVSPEGTEEGWRKTHAALDRIEAERAGRDYLVGDSFSVADLTAAALAAPLIQPPGFPYPVRTLPPSLQAVRAELLAHPAADWMVEVYRRHRPAEAPRAAV
jgi:glutathione S-transferase